MTWAGALTALETALTTAAATVNALDTAKDPFRVRRGEPFSLLARQVAYWYEGDQESGGGNTLTAENVDEKVTVRWYWPVLNRDDTWVAALEVQLQAANRATQSALLGADHLGGNCIALRIDSTSAGWQNVGEAWVRVLTIPIRIEVVDVATIAN